ELFDGHSLRDAFASRDTMLLAPYYATALSEPLKKARAELSQAIKKYFYARNPVVETSIMQEIAEPRATFVLARGRYDTPKTADKRVSRSTPAFLTPFPKGATLNRLGFAEWLTDPRSEEHTSEL